MTKLPLSRLLPARRPAWSRSKFAAVGIAVLAGLLVLALLSFLGSPGRSTDTSASGTLVDTSAGEDLFGDSIAAATTPTDPAPLFDITIPELDEGDELLTESAASGALSEGLSEQSSSEDTTPSGAEVVDNSSASDPLPIPVPTGSLASPARNSRGQKGPAASSACTVRVMPLGDSLTAFAESYRGPLYRKLVADGTAVDFVGSVKWEPTGGGDPDGEGHGGYRIGPDDEDPTTSGEKPNLAANVDRWVPAAEPDVILLTIGTNDMGSESFSKAAPKKYAALVAKLQELAPKATIVMGDIPQSTYDPKSTGAAGQVNAKAKSLGDAKADDLLVYSPNASRMRAAGLDPNNPEHMGDGVHFTEFGGKLFADAWLPTVQPIIAARAASCSS